MLHCVAKPFGAVAVHFVWLAKLWCQYAGAGERLNAIDTKHAALARQVVVGRHIPIARVFKHRARRDGALGARGGGRREVSNRHLLGGAQCLAQLGQKLDVGNVHHHHRVVGQQRPHLG